MTNFLKLLLASVAACLLAFAVVGCGGGSVSSSAPKSVPDLTLPANNTPPVSTDTTSSDTTATGTATDGTATDVIDGVPEDTTPAPDENIDVPADTTAADSADQTDATQQQTTPDTSAAGGAGIQ